MPPLNGTVREHVLREMREEIQDLASQGATAAEIVLRLNGHRTLTGAEESLIELLTYHAIAEVRGTY